MVCRENFIHFIDYGFDCGIAHTERIAKIKQIQSGMMMQHQLFNDIEGAFLLRLRNLLIVKRSQQGGYHIGVQLIAVA